jgi:hypothetical protein
MFNCFLSFFVCVEVFDGYLNNKQFNITIHNRMSHLQIMSTGQGHIYKYEYLNIKIYNCNATIYRVTVKEIHTFNVVCVSLLLHSRYQYDSPLR